MSRLDDVLADLRRKNAAKSEHETRQSRYYWKKRSLRQCVKCGKQLLPTDGIRCKKHRDQNTALKRRKKGYKAWRQGGPGRPPKAV